jgi:hypothetical protein
MTDIADLPDPVPADPFAQAAAEKPGCKLVRVIDPEFRVEFILAFAPGSRYFDFDIDRQTIEIKRTAAPPAIADLANAHAAGAV